jgi:TetR/AcrR family transcriptional regulator, mexCD-oprJ operon repressor
VTADGVPEAAVSQAPPQAPQATDRRRAIADRNVHAILDAAEELLRNHAPVTIAAVASQAGVSRVTVYAHFATGGALLEAVVERAVRHAAAALAAAAPESGPPLEALTRLVAAGWRELGANAAMAEAAAARLSADAMARSHHAAQRQVAELVTRGRRDGTFRTDVPESWLVTCCFALFHSCADEIRAGRLDAADAERVLTITLTALFTGS